MSLPAKPAQSNLDAAVDGLALSDLNIDSCIVASKLHMTDTDVTPLVTPIYQTSTYTVKSVEQFLGRIGQGGYIYSRCGNPTTDAAECALNVIEGGAGSLTFPTGMSAICTTLTCLLNAGDHIVCCNPVYSGTHKFVTKLLPKWNVEVTFVAAGCSVDEYKKAVRPNTKVLYGETPCNPLISILDLAKFGELGESLPGVYTVVDSTFGSPYCQQPCKHGVDISIHSATKYLGGHSDLCAGVITCRTEELWSKIYDYKVEFGSCMSPPDAAMLSRSMKTLHVRMQRHCSNAQRCAEFLEQHPKIETVYYPGLTSHPGHEVAKKQMNGFSGTMSFEMKGGLQAAKTVVESVRLIHFAVSLGGVESLIEHAASMTHGPLTMTDEERKEAWISDGLVRLSVGLEDPDDIIADLKQALDKVKE